MIRCGFYEGRGYFFCGLELISCWDAQDFVLPDGPPARRAATSWRVYLFLLG